MIQGQKALVYHIQEKSLSSFGVRVTFSPVHKYETFLLYYEHFRPTEKLKEFHQENPATYQLDSTVNILLNLLYRGII